MSSFFNYLADFVSSKIWLSGFLLVEFHTAEALKREVSALIQSRI